MPASAGMTKRDLFCGSIRDRGHEGQSGSAGLDQMFREIPVILAVHIEALIGLGEKG